MRGMPKEGLDGAASGVEIHGTVSLCIIALREKDMIRTNSWIAELQI